MPVRETAVRPPDSMRSGALQAGRDLLPHRADVGGPMVGTAQGHPSVVHRGATPPGLAEVTPELRHVLDTPGVDALVTDDPDRFPRR